MTDVRHSCDDGTGDMPNVQCAESQATSLVCTVGVSTVVGSCDLDGLTLCSEHQQGYERFDMGLTLLTKIDSSSITSLGTTFPELCRERSFPVQAAASLLSPTKNLLGGRFNEVFTHVVHNNRS